MKSKVAALVLVIVLGAFLAFRWQGKDGRESGDGGSAAASTSPAMGSTAAPAAGPHAGAAKTERPPAEAKRSAQPLDLDGLQKGLMEKAEKAVLGSSGDAAARSRVQIELEKLKAFKQAGMGQVHPNVVISRLRLAKEVDLLGDSDRGAGEARLTGYLDCLQAELEGSADGKPVDELLTRWRRELKREDSFEAAVIASLGTGLTKEGLQGRLKFFRDGIMPAPAEEGGEPSDPGALKGR